MKAHLNRNDHEVKTLILGMGNEYLGDAGAGIHAVRALLREGCPKNTEAFEVGAGTMEALVALQRADRVVIIDSLRVTANQAPYTKCLWWNPKPMTLSLPLKAWSFSGSSICPGVWFFLK